METIHRCTSQLLFAYMSEHIHYYLQRNRGDNGAPESYITISQDDDHTVCTYHRDDELFQYTWHDI